MKLVAALGLILAVSTPALAQYQGQYSSNPYTPNRTNPYASSQNNLYDSNGFAGNTGSRYDPDSINNPYGQYGSRYSPDSVNNPYSERGSRYSADSPNNPYGQGMMVCGPFGCD
ncbi:hypothetical protein [Aureimonas altamirensis]|uniref:hypothetical protein n=1 Tax=Aureimonas altamirensis TaxID=370622 RepID=UPI002555A1DC|nr:hypothetical protein [Aureimonas altamirensis]